MALQLEYRGGSYFISEEELNDTSITEISAYFDEEMKHLAHIVARIYILGGRPTTKPTKIIVGNNLKEFCTLGYEAEKVNDDGNFLKPGLKRN